LDYDNRSHFSIVAIGSECSIQFVIRGSRDAFLKIYDRHHFPEEQIAIWPSHNNGNDRMLHSMPGLSHNGTQLPEVLHYHFPVHEESVQ